MKNKLLYGEFSNVCVISPSFGTLIFAQVFKQLFMRRIFLLILVGLMLSCSVFLAAQNRFKASAVAGLNLSQIDGDLLTGFDQPGLHAGMHVSAILSDRWELGVELLYNQQGSQRNLYSNSQSIYESIRLNVVEAPVQILFNEWKFQLGAGLSYARIINAKVIDVSGADITLQQGFRDDLTNVVLGGTFNFSERWALNVRWSRSLNNLRANKADGLFISRTLGIRGIYYF